MRRSHFVFSVAVAGALLAIAPAAAVADPNTFASAQRGSLLVSSSALVANRSAEMMGGWVNEKVACNADRRLTVRILIDRVRGSHTDRVRRKKTGPVTNCAEGGPNFGFDLAPRSYRMACANGRWRPGRYSMTTKTTDTRSGLIAQASLYHQVTRRC